MNIELNNITETLLFGEWKVEDRYINDPQSNPFEDTKLLEFQENFYQSVNGKVFNGKWKISFEDELIYNPKLKFFVGDNLFNDALITRMYIEHNIHKMYLYFTNGLELILVKV